MLVSAERSTNAKVQNTRLPMYILSDPVFTFVPFALWIGLIIVVLSSFLGDEKPGLPFRSARDILEEHLTRQDIGREEYVDRRKALDYITRMVCRGLLTAVIP